jgi:hypothetical protein
MSGMKNVPGKQPKDDNAQQEGEHDH